MAKSSSFVIRDDGDYDLVETNHRTDEITILDTVTEAEMEVYFAPSLEDTLMMNRLQREGLLGETDWWAVSDRTMTDDQIAYRQALRNMPTHENWPNLNEDDWPTKPV
jgi:hypothetical protein